MSFSIPFNPIRYPWHFWRVYVVQPLFWSLALLSPVLGLYQMDVIHQWLIFLNHPYPLAPHTLMFLPLTFFSTVLVIGITCLFYGRLFCGWVCPHNTLTEWLAPWRALVGLAKAPFGLERHFNQRPWLKWVVRTLAVVWGFVVAWTISTLILFYFVPPDWYFGHFGHWDVEVETGTFHYTFVLLAAHTVASLVGTFLLLAGHEFCRNACPYGLLQSLSAYAIPIWWPAEIRFRYGADQTPCGHCRACETACPIDIDPRRSENLIVGIGEGCFNCGQCIDACRVVHSTRELDSFLFFRPPGRYPGEPKTRVGRDVAE